MMQFFGLLDQYAELIYQVSASIFGATFVFTLLVSSRDSNRLWHAYSALLLLLTVTTVGFALIRSDQALIPEPVLSGLIRLMFVIMSIVAMSINGYIAWWLAQRSEARVETHR